MFKCIENIERYERFEILDLRLEVSMQDKLLQRDDYYSSLQIGASIGGFEIIAVGYNKDPVGMPHQW